MEELIKLQEDTHMRISKAYKNFKKSPKDRLTQGYVETRLETLEQFWLSCSTNHQKIVQIALDESQDSKYFMEDTFDMIEELYTLYKSELKQMLLTFKVSPIQVSNACNSNSKSNAIKLPKIVIPTFSGLYSEWTTFRDLYVSLIHTNSQLDSVQKLHYLKGYLSGEAEQLVRQIPITESNYERCWELLNSRYNNKKCLCNAILKKLLSQRNVTIESPTLLKNLIDNTSDCLSALTNIGVDVTSWDVLLIHLLTLKLDSETRKEWEMHISNVNDLDELPAFSQFKEFLTKRYRALEFLEPKSAVHKSNIQSNSNKAKVFHATEAKCAFCNDDHKLNMCNDFKNADVNNRRKFIEQNGLCFKCFGHHAAKYCQSNITCRICKRKHHTMLHPKGASGGGSGGVGNSPSVGSDNLNKVVASTSGEGIKGLPSRNGPSSSTESVDTPVVTCYSSGQMPVQRQVLLATALINAESSMGECHMIRALLDQGSQASFVTEAVAQYLGIKKIPVQGHFSGLEGNKNISVKYMVELYVRPRFDSNIRITVRAYVLNSITSFLPSRNVVGLNWIELSEICLADPQFHTPNKIDILLGAEVYGQIIKDGIKTGPKGTPIAQNTSFGWIISGIVPHTQNKNIVSMHTCIEDNEVLKRFWEIESDPKEQRKILSLEEQRCEEYFAATTKRDSEGRYIVKLPFKEECNHQFDSKEIAVKRLKSLYSKFIKDDKFRKEYSKVVQDYQSLGYIEMVPKSEIDKNSSFYLPHHAVVKNDRTTTKLRVVFDASCKDKNGISLNSTLMVGPKLQPELRHLIMRWRTHPICLSADIVKMYLQVKVAQEDADYQRFLWDEKWNLDEGNGTCNEDKGKSKRELQEYRLLRVMFGTASAPYLAVKALQQLSLDEGSLYPETAEKIRTDYYMDDLLTGCQTVEKGIIVYKEMNTLLQKGGFQLQKWTTNNEDLLESLRQEEGKELGNTVNFKTDEIVKLLGFTWNRKTDDFHYTVTLPPQTGPVTKRKVLSDISRLYDPLGWLAPSIITAKIFMQKLWLASLSWDEELPKHLLNEWNSYREELLNLTKFVLHRWVNTRSDDKVTELHGFADASSVAYSAVVYLRVIDSNDNVHVSLVTCKTRVAPIKQLSIPKMELCGSTLLSKLLREVSEILKINKSYIHAWTDSEVVLAWLSGHPSKWQTFVGNRVSEILQTLDREQWHHVSSSQNPADCASRGLKPSDLVEYSMWLHGPAMLHEKDIMYKKPKNVQTDLETRKVVHFTEVDNSLFLKYSSLTKLVRVVAYCRRFLRFKNRDSSKVSSTYLTSQELLEATETCIRQCQREHFEQELKYLEKGQPNNVKAPLKPLNPYIDSKGLLRVGGRLENSQLSENQKHPILIPKTAHLTKLIVSDAHFKTLHGGPQLMLAYLQSKYWILGAKLLVKSHVRKCIICFKDKAATLTPLMGQLPSARVTPTKPFTCCGVDYAGPISVRTTKGRGYKAYKGYICLFICMATKAIHLEVVSDLTTQGFLAAYKRFVSRRGICTDIWSDNGTNFVGASRELPILFASEKSQTTKEIAESLATTGTAWHFIPPHSPNFGGLWESGVKSVKGHLRKVIGNLTLTYEELSTVLAQIEACLNSRPLSRLDSDTENLEVLTPGHFLVGGPLITPPDHNFESSNVTNLRRWQLVQKLTQQFWRRWSQDYLTKYLYRYRWSYQTPEPQIGDIILVKESDLPPCKWLLGRVVSKHPGSDGITRVVSLKTKTSVIKRPVSKLCVLPLAE